MLNPLFETPCTYGKTRSANHSIFVVHVLVRLNKRTFEVLVLLVLVFEYRGVAVAVDGQRFAAQLERRRQVGRMKRAARQAVLHLTVLTQDVQLFLINIVTIS